MYWTRYKLEALRFPSAKAMQVFSSRIKIKLLPKYAWLKSPLINDALSDAFKIIAETANISNIKAALTRIDSVYWNFMTLKRYSNTFTYY